ncbi:hypothetical protein I4U23_000701 [Adineta vaga]|nr:hypothetical protein I4U23_000701 [Adineta vaga]
MAWNRKLILMRSPSEIIKDLVNDLLLDFDDMMKIIYNDIDKIQDDEKLGILA